MSLSSTVLSALGIASSEGLTPHPLLNLILASFQNLTISPEDIPSITPQAAQLSVDLEQAYVSQAQHTRETSTADNIEQFYGSRKREYENLQTDIKFLRVFSMTSGDLLDLLSELLAHFQSDLSSVLTSIAELQGCSKLIDNLLEGRRAFEKIKARGWTKITLVADPQLNHTTAFDDLIILQSKLKGADLILAYLAKDSLFFKALFRSSSLVAMDNTISEWSFADHFFGQPTLGIDQQNIDSTDSTLFPNTPISGSGRSTPMVRKASFVSSITDPNSYLTGTPSKINSNNGVNEQKS
ncbi:hypothetical protein H4Q26_000084 [Puccinia striiformis f. sp. tritici PST-130]|nr:hypothetical protein H4Q26_000084 [Puccinia striiformis f. sp. tritici PST-130]